jgi:hypothetical protein
MPKKLEEQFERALNEAKDQSLPKVVHGLSVDGSYVGTCQACFGQYVVKQFKSSESRAGGDMLKPMPKGKLVVVLHGYERPGHGYVTGECPGRGHEPFEVAKDVTELFQEKLKRGLAHAKERLSQLKSGQVTKLLVEIEDRSQGRNPRTWKYPIKIIEIEEGWKNPDDSFDSFSRHMKREISQSEARVEGLKEDLNFIEMMLRKWKYDPQSLTRTTGRKIGVRADVQAKAEAQSKARSAERNAARDEKERKARAVLDAYLGHAEAMRYAKSTQTQIIDRERGYGFKPSGETYYDLAMRKYIKPAENEQSQVRRIELLKYAYGTFRDMASRADIKVKVPRG